jgi:hypothetical protein
LASHLSELGVQVAHPELEFPHHDALRNASWR